jgi:serine protease inhibitor
MNKLSKILILTLVILPLLIFITFCSNTTENNNNQAENDNQTNNEDNTDTEESSSKADLDKVADSANMFAMDMFSSIEKEIRASSSGKTKNIFISPYSIFTALSMTNNGTSGNMRKGMSETLHIAGYDIETVNQSLKQINERLGNKDRNIELLIANSIWQAKDFPIKDSFIQTMKTYYDAMVKAVTFGDPKTKDLINDWISDKTKGLIKNMVSETTPDDIMYLVNAIYFFGNWIRQFDKEDTTDQPFYMLDGKSKDVPMMYAEDDYLYYSSKGFHAVRLSYGKIEKELDEPEFYQLLFSDEFVSMYLFVPEKKDGLYEMLDSLNHKKLGNIFDQFYSSKVNLTMPKFKIEFGKGGDKNILDNLKSMGMPIKDSFENLTDKAPEKLYISKALHQAVVDVNEEGTEAAAATVVGVTIESMPNIVEFKADRPFLFVIRDDKTGVILFMGVLKEPKAD